MTVAGGTTASDHSAMHCNDALNVADGSRATFERCPLFVCWTPYQLTMVHRRELAVSAKGRRLVVRPRPTGSIHASFAQPTPSQISKRATVTTDIPVETTTAEDTVSTCTLYC